MVEVDKSMDFASRGVGGAALGTGIAGLSLGVLNALGNGGLNGLLGGWGNGCSENSPVNRYELSMVRDLTNKDMEIAYLKGRDAAKTDSLELYRYVDGKVACIERELADQRVFNATQIGTINCIQGQIGQLMGLTKLVVPNGSVCPGWGDVTVSVTPTTTA